METEVRSRVQAIKEFEGHQLNDTLNNLKLRFKVLKTPDGRTSRIARRAALTISEHRHHDDVEVIWVESHT